MVRLPDEKTDLVVGKEPSSSIFNGRRKNNTRPAPLFPSYSRLDYYPYLGIERKNVDDSSNDDWFAAAPIIKGGGDDFPSGAAETALHRKRKYIA